MGIFKKISRLPIFQTIHGRQALSLWASKIFEKSGIKQLFGLNLVAVVFFTGVVTPQANTWLNQFTIENKTYASDIAADTITQTTLALPLPADTFAISQFFSFWHPGIDMTAPLGTPVTAVEDGTVEEVQSAFFGYGKHVIMSHSFNLTTLYAHLSEIKTVVGRKVVRGEVIGKVGSTGWSSGNHLHFEIWQNHYPLNPVELLPIQPEKIKYDGILTQTSTPSAQPSPTL